MTLATGARLGPYEVTVPLGVGGMGAVYRARDTKLQRDVALKVLLPEVANDPERLARFRREAQVLASLNHPHIGAIYGLEESDGTTALVLELVEGPTLADRIAQGPIPLDEALHMAKQVAEALEAAHEQGIVHRDLKPANIKVRADGTVKVLDFGLAKAVEPVGAIAPSHSMSPTITTPAMTQGGMILGTAAYMSPEQARGKTVDKRTDLWAFGAVLFEMLTGTRAFRGEDVTDTLALIVRGEPAWQTLPPGVPARVRQVLRSCLQKEPRQRLGDMQSVRLALDGAFETVAQTDAVPSSPARPHGWRLVAGGLALVALTGIAVSYGTRPQSTERAADLRPMIVEVPKPPARSPLHFAFSPSGTHIAMAAIDGDGGDGLWLRPLDQISGQFLAGTRGGVGVGTTYPFWSPDGRFIAFFSDGSLKRVDLSGAPPQTLCDAPAGRGGSWNRDDVIVFAPTASGPLFRVSARGGVPTQLTELDTSREEIAHRHPYFLPDGSHFIYLSVSSKAENSGVWMGSLDSRDRTFLVNTTQKATFAAPDWLLFMRQNTLLAQRLDLRGPALIGDPMPIADGVGMNLSNGAAGFTTSENGELAYRGQALFLSGTLNWIDRSGKESSAVDVPSPYAGAALAPDSQQIAVRIGGYVVGQGGDIWILDTTRGTRTRFTFDPADDASPVWSPDGSQVVFSSNRGGAYDLYVKSGNGVGQEEILLKSDRSKYPESWSADGRFLLYREGDPRTGLDLWALPMTGDKKPVPVVRTQFDETQGRFAPDGRWVAYVSNESGRNEVYLQGFPDGTTRMQVSTSGGAAPAWRNDGRELFYFVGAAAIPGGDPVAVTAMAVDIAVSPDGALKAGLPHKLFSTSATGATVAPDGSRFLITSPVDRSNSPDAHLTIVLNWQAALAALKK